MKSLDCTASIVVYNNPPDMIRRILESLLSCSLDIELHIVDNSPTQLLKSSLVDIPVKYHFYGCNLGYGRGHNKAIERCSDSNYHVVINPDIIIDPSVIETLTAFMDENTDIGMVCPKVRNADGTIQYLNKRRPTVYDLFLRRFSHDSFRSFFQKRLDYYEMKDFGYDSIYDVPFVAGSFMFCRTEILKKVGGFDPRYFMYFEDADLSRKFQEYNYRTVFYPYVSVTHLWERAPHKSIKMALVLIANGIKYFNKWGWRFY